LQHSLRLQPSAAAWLNLGMVEQSAGNVPQTLACFEHASELNPSSAEPHFKRGVALRSWNNATLAIAAFREALRAEPAHAAALCQLAEVCAAAGYTAEAVEAFGQVYQLTGDDAMRVRAALTMPIIIESEQQITDVRVRLQEGLDVLAKETLLIKNPLVVGTPLFPLAYHGRDEHEFQTRVADLLRWAAPHLAYVAPHCNAPINRDAGQRIKLGFVSLNLGDHTIGKLNAGLIERIDRQRFEVLVFGADRLHEVLGQRIAAGADRHVILKPDLLAARAQIAEERLDVLFYTDVGLEPMSYCLAHGRLAAVQCVTWGHPLTTGIPTLDYFISSDELEPPGSESQYSETVVRLPSLAVHYFRPQRTNSTRTRADFGLDPQAHLYACLQSPFKLHPDDDQVWTEILRHDPQARLLLLEGQFPEWGQRLRERFSRSMSDVAGRIQFVEQQPPAEFARLLELVDVLLDPLHFGGGETSYQSFAVGTPVVTLPGGFLRNRITNALYRAMGVSDCIANTREDYIARAVRFGTNPELCEQVRGRILAANNAIFEQDNGVRALESFLDEVFNRQEGQLEAF
jgi:predicted O-linked N-acetylglucosamine transferase (SPINDLY family)